MLVILLDELAAIPIVLALEYGWDGAPQIVDQARKVVAQDDRPAGW